MPDDVTVWRCEHCHETGHLRPVSNRLARCAACNYLLPRPRPAAPLPPSSTDWPKVAPGGSLRGRYRLLEPLVTRTGESSYVAQHEYLGHLCTVNFLPSGAATLANPAMTRLRNEARAGFHVQDPCVARLLDCDCLGGTWYFVTEFIDGVDLAHGLSLKQRLDWRQAVAVATDAARGLAAIHQAGLLHRGIMPTSLLLGLDARVRICDLGVAAVAGELRSTSRSVPTLVYTAPELFRIDAEIGPAVDLYALGSTLFHLLTGRPPHAATQVFQLLVDVQNRPVSWPTDLELETPRWLIDLVLQLLAINPADRPASAAAVVERLTKTVDAILPRPAGFVSESLLPRGVGVFPFRNEGVEIEDDWLGYAVANYLTRALSEAPDVYVADQDGLIGVVQRLQAEAPPGTVVDPLEAGRLVGAGTIVSGHFRRSGPTVRIAADIRRTGRVGTESISIEGPLSDLPQLERTLFERLARVLRLGRMRPEHPQAIPLDAREKHVNAKQAFLSGDYERAITLAQEALQIEPEFCEAIGFMGVCLARMGRYDEAEACHTRQQEVGRRCGDPRREVEALANLGVMNYFRGAYEAAQQQFAAAANLSEHLELSAENALICNNLGFVLYRVGRLAEAERAFLRAIETHSAYGSLTALVGPYNGMGNVLAEQQRYEEAQTYYRRALALAAEIGDRTSMGTTHMHLGRCAALEGRFADAKHEFTMALNALEETRFWNGLARAYEYIAEMHLQLENWEEAVRCADKRIELARQHANDRMEAAAWLQKAEALSRAGRTEDAEACRRQAGQATGAGRPG